MARKYIFNLLQPLRPPRTFWDKVYDWIVSRARIVLVVLEIILVVVFLSKVIVDNQGKNLEQQYDRLFTQMDELSVTYEDEFRDTQAKEIEYRKIWSNVTFYSEILRELDTYTDLQAGISTSIGDGQIIISGSDFLSNINLLELSMKNSNTFNDVLLTLNQNEQNITEGTGQFTITAFLDEDLSSRDGLSF
jgi:hypothetical protein